MVILLLKQTLVLMKTQLEDFILNGAGICLRIVNNMEKLQSPTVKSNKLCVLTDFSFFQLQFWILPYCTEMDIILYTISAEQCCQHFSEVNGYFLLHHQRTPDGILPYFSFKYICYSLCSKETDGAALYGIWQFIRLLLDLKITLCKSALAILVNCFSRWWEKQAKFAAIHCRKRKSALA